MTALEETLGRIEEQSERVATAAEELVELRRGKGKSVLHAPRKLSLACGDQKPDGFFGVDISPDCDADVVHDLLSFPWPLKTGCAVEVECAHFVEHIPHDRPGSWGYETDGWFEFFNELWRVCRKDAVVTIVHPYCQNGRAFWDPTHHRYIHEATWAYLNKEWRRNEKLDHYQANHDFEIVSVDGIGVAETFQTRNEETQAFARRHYMNVIDDLVVKLKALK